MARRRNTKNKKKLKSPSMNPLVQKNISNSEVISFLAIISTLIGAFIGIFQFIREEIKDKPIEHFSYESLGLIEELTKLNSSYDTTRSNKDIERIVEIIIYNFLTLKLQKPDQFNQSISKLKFYNSAFPSSSKNLIPYNGLTSMFLKRGDKTTVEFFANIRYGIGQLPMQYPDTPFPIWWEKQIVMDDRLGNEFTRRSLIMSFALYNSQRNHPELSRFEKIKVFNYLGINIENNALVLSTFDTHAKKPLIPKEKPSKYVLNSLLNECIRAISGEIVETLVKSHIK